MERVLSLIEHYGYLVVFFGVMIESIGVPLPGETILIASGLLAQRGHLDVGDAIAFGILGAVVGDQIGYWAGRKGGRPFVLRWGRYVRITPERLARAEAFFAHHGGKAVFLARFVAGFRVFGALVAGISRMHWRSFAFYNALGGVVWATAAVWVRYDAQLRWLLRRLTPGQYLGLHLTVGLAFAAGCLWLFGGLAEDVVTSDPIVRVDRSVADYLHSSATPPLTTFFLVVTAFGSIVAVGLLGVLVAAFFASGRRWLYLGTWLAAVGGSAVLNQLLKALFARPRPFFEHPLLVEISYSFPSGHAMESLVAYGMLAYFAVLALRTWKWRVAVVFAAALLVVLIGLSRMYLGVHYLSDVVAGYAAGGLWLSALITATETVRRRGKQGSELQ